MRRILSVVFFAVLAVSCSQQPKQAAPKPAEPQAHEVYGAVDLPNGPVALGDPVGEVKRMYGEFSEPHGPITDGLVCSPSLRECEYRRESVAELMVLSSDGHAINAIVNLSGGVYVPGVMIGYPMADVKEAMFGARQASSFGGSPTLVLEDGGTVNYFVFSDCDTANGLSAIVIASKGYEHLADSVVDTSC